MNLADARRVAQRVIDMLTPGCMQAEVAGSVRRCKPEPKDIEIVARARTVEEQDLFGAAIMHSELEDLIHQLVIGDAMAFDQAVRRNGPKAKRLLYEGIVVDLFIADEANFGNTLAIRTGDSEFSHLLVTPRRLGGLMPGHLVQRDGYLWHGDELIACPTEGRYFEALQIQWVDPQFRNQATARDLTRRSIREVPMP